MNDPRTVKKRRVAEPTLGFAHADDAASSGGFIPRPTTIAVSRESVGTSTYREVAKEILVLDVGSSAGSRIRLLLVAVAVACFATFDRLSTFAPLHLVAAGLGLALVVYATGPIGAGRTRMTVSRRALTSTRHPLALGRAKSFDLARIMALRIESKHDEIHVCVALAGPPETAVVAIVKTAHEAKFIVQEIETHLGRRPH